MRQMLHLAVANRSLWLAVLMVVTLLLMPSNAPLAQAQTIHSACLDDAGRAVVPSTSGGVGAWLIVLNFNHTPSATTTTGCRVTTTSLNPQKVTRSLVTCQLVNNQGLTQVGGGSAAFDGKFTVQCPGNVRGPGATHNNKNFTILGRANFASAQQTYSIVQHQDVTFKANLSVDWRVAFESRYGATTFVSGNPTFNMMGQIVHFESAIQRQTGSHRLNQSALTPTAAVAPFTFTQSLPFTIGAARQIWTLYELIIDPPGGCCRS